MQEILNILPEQIAEMMRRIDANRIKEIQEIRLRINKPIRLKVGTEEYGLSEKGLTKLGGAYFTADDSARLWRKLSMHSPYTLIESQKNGFITINGGHRIGICGEALSEADEIKHFKHISSYCIRCANQFVGSALKVIDYLLCNNQIYSTLIISPPGCGKTTLLRDLARTLSNRGYNVVVIDERNEIAASLDGIPTLDVGSRTDIYTGCKKAYAMESVLRSMAPEVIFTDEISGDHDSRAITEIIKAGVALIATAHGQNAKDVLDRPSFSIIKQEKLFDRYVLLKNRTEVGQVEDIYDKDLNSLLNRGVKRCC